MAEVADSGVAAEAAADPSVRLLLDALPLPRRTRVVDVGANPFEDEAPYARLLAMGGCDVVGFEPQPAAFAALKARTSDRETYFPFAVGDGSDRDLRLYRGHGFASVFDPYLPGTRLMPLRGWHEIARKIPFTTVTLDAAPDVGPFDLLKIDIQGGELDVFRGGRTALKEAVAVITEVRFFRLYEGEPMLGAVDQELRAQGFELHKFQHTKGRALHNSQIDRLRHHRLRDQLLDGDAIYVRDITRPERMSDAQVAHLALLAASVIGSPTLALVCLDELVGRGSVEGSLPARYADSLPLDVRRVPAADEGRA